MEPREKMDILGKLEEKAIKDLSVLADKPDVTPVEWSRIKEVLGILEDIKECKPFDSMNGYSEGYMPYENPYGNRYSYGNSMGGNYGMMGSMGNNYSNGNSRGGNYGSSRHSVRDRMIERMEQMMDGATSEYEREVIRNEINKLRMEG